MVVFVWLLFWKGRKKERKESFNSIGGAGSLLGRPVVALGIGFVRGRRAP
jgi:hypothetical protein